MRTNREQIMKRLFFLCFSMLLLSILSAEDLNVVVDQNRFFDDAGNTIFEINYQIAYKDLDFVWHDSLGFVASLLVDFQLQKSDKVIYKDGFTNKIIVRAETSTRSNNMFTDKISFTLAKSGVIFVMECRDENSDLTLSWSHGCISLDPGSLASDLELSSEVLRDTTNYLPKFHRDGVLYKVITSHVFSTSLVDSIAVYCELQNYQLDSEGISDLDLKIFVRRKDEIISIYSKQINTDKKTYALVSWVDINNLETGYYTLIIEVYDQLSSVIEVKEDFFSIKQPKLFTQRMFVDIEDELKLINYFLDKSLRKNWKSLTETGKANFISRFWTTSDPDPSTERNEYFDLIKKRVQYCNQEYSHFNKGWSSDRGRVYLRHGKPDEIIKEETGLNTKYAQKDLQIWKYRTRENMTYIFIDLQTSGNHKMIYAEGDDLESSQAGWESYLGQDFDMGILE